MVCTVQTALVGWIFDDEDDEVANVYDMWCCVGISVVFVALNLFHILDSVRTRRRNEGKKYKFDGWKPGMARDVEASKERDMWDGGICVYLDSGDGKGLGEYRHWKLDNSPFDANFGMVLDTAIFLFGETGIHDEDVFYAQNSLRHERSV